MYLGEKNIHSENGTLLGTQIIPLKQYGIIEDDTSFDLLQIEIEKMLNKLNQKKEEIIKGKIFELGIEPTLDFMKSHLSHVTYEGENIEHYYLYFGSLNQKRLVSFNKMPNMPIFDLTKYNQMDFEINYY